LPTLPLRDPATWSPAGGRLLKLPLEAESRQTLSITSRAFDSFGSGLYSVLTLGSSGNVCRSRLEQELYFMSLHSQAIQNPAITQHLRERFGQIRNRSLNLCNTLEIEDFVVQSMPSVSPAKWHLAHTTWFFEQFILIPRKPRYAVYDERFHHLFNSYYYTEGQMFRRADRGLLSRPTVSEITNYRNHVDHEMDPLLNNLDDAELCFLIELGLNHEEQHQELMLTDIKHVFSVNPLKPALLERDLPPTTAHADDLAFVSYEGGIKKIGTSGANFHFDNETPQHRVFLEPFTIAKRPILNREFKAFMDDGGYSESTLWLSDGWAWAQNENIDRPLYWSPDHATAFTLNGEREIDPHAPVCHVSFYEADAYSRWAKSRLPTEAEWETVAGQEPIEGNFMDQGVWQPTPSAGNGKPLQQLFGDVWEWTASAYSPYPGFQPLGGSLGEYNGKFMCNQMVCRGGSCVTPTDHIRATYRNFFYPQDRWQFFGIRLARNA
jgi:ergothioneine biosynthesis protein EgtB